MITSVQAWSAALSVRERWLVGIAGALATAVIGWLLILQPLLDGIDRARMAQRAALDRHGSIVAQVNALRRPAGPRSAVPGSAINLVVAQSAAEQGFTLDRNQATSGDNAGNAASIAIATAQAPALLGWISTLEAQGIQVREMTIRPNGNGTVALTATVAQ